jgi:hypothetical protein
MGLDLGRLRHLKKLRCLEIMMHSVRLIHSLRVIVREIDLVRDSLILRGRVKDSPKHLVIEKLREMHLKKHSLKGLNLLTHFLMLKVKEMHLVIL